MTSRVTRQHTRHDDKARSASCFFLEIFGRKASSCSDYHVSFLEIPIYMDSRLVPPLQALHVKLQAPKHLVSWPASHGQLQHQTGYLLTSINSAPDP